MGILKKLKEFSFGIIVLVGAVILLVVCLDTKLSERSEFYLNHPKLINEPTDKFNNLNELVATKVKLEKVDCGSEQFECLLENIEDVNILKHELVDFEKIKKILQYEYGGGYIDKNDEFASGLPSYFSLMAAVDAYLIYYIKNDVPVGKWNELNQLLENSYHQSNSLIEMMVAIALLEHYFQSIVYLKNTNPEFLEFEITHQKITLEEYEKITAFELSFSHHYLERLHPVMLFLYVKNKNFNELVSWHDKILNLFEMKYEESILYIEELKKSNEEDYKLYGMMKWQDMKIDLGGFFNYLDEMNKLFLKSKLVNGYKIEDMENIQHPFISNAVSFYDESNHSYCFEYHESPVCVKANY